MGPTTPVVSQQGVTPQSSIQLTPNSPYECYRARMADPTLRILTYGMDGALLREFTIDEPTEAPKFYAHQLLHADGVVCVEVRYKHGGADRFCDPGLDFDQVVNG